MKMPKECQDMINDCQTAAFSTCSLDAVPNAVPVGVKRVVDDETVMVSDQFLNKSLKNLQANPHVALTVWDDSSGFQVKGTVTYENEGPRYEEMAAQVDAMFSKIGLDYKSKGVCFISVEEVYSVTPGEHAGELIC